MEEKTAGAASHSSECLFCSTVRPFLERCWSDATRDHFRTSRVEFLKGVRSLIDARIARLSSQEHPKGTHVSVE